LAYSKTTARTAHSDTVTAAFHNSIMAELKAAAENITLHDVDKVIAYTGNKISTITITDNSATSGYDITAVMTFIYTGWKVTQIVTVFDVGEMNITVTEVFSYSGWKCTGIARTLS